MQSHANAYPARPATHRGFPLPSPRDASSNFLRRGVVLLAAFVLWTAAVATGWLHVFDLRLLVVLQQHVPQILDGWMTVFSVLGLTEVTGVVVLVLAVSSWRAGSRRRAAALILGFTAVGATELAFKLLMHHPGPVAGRYALGGHMVAVAARTRIDVWLAALPIHFPSGEVTLLNAYPSGHLARSAYVLTWLLAGRPRSTRRSHRTFVPAAVATLFMLVMAFTRVILAEHWPTEVVGGWLLGAAFASLAWAWHAQGGRRPPADGVPVVQ